MDMESNTCVREIYQVAAPRVMSCPDCSRDSAFIGICYNQCTYLCDECFRQFGCEPVLVFSRFRNYLTSSKHQHHAHLILDRCLEVHDIFLDEDELKCICNDLKEGKDYKDYLLYKLSPNLFEEDIFE